VLEFYKAAKKNGFNFLNYLKTVWKYELSNGIFANRFLKAFFFKGNAALNEDQQSYRIPDCTIL